ncbi:response regulator [Candidatus Falkowbacteria bacterium CG10_big_fil_rev_8_21_14_0_10_37_6]|uniref:Response regulator n=1 Tax=Candidatus Falkowbacteria bacterium CG10_big_fil_rev_8_21_14_0_10_37_6 TaxID=1974563 RepID=A0A2H0V9G4_9BACT|nr:MAG: response regulator [Candidatus Falkowbacteria bacterium CG10_big_fil_rev_8_21_14_0_10_37_6]
MKNTHSSNKSCKKKKILIVEDDQTIGNMYKTGLTNYGYDVVLADDGEKGVNLAKSEKPDIILLDIIMPRVDGFAALSSLKEDPKTKHIPVLMLTNLGQDEDKERGKELGAIDYIVKADLTPMQVSEKIKQYLK